VGHVESVRDAHDARLDRVRLAAAAVADDRVERLGDHDGPLSGVAVDVGQQLAQLALGQKQAVGLVVGAMDRHPDVVQQRAGRNHHFSVAVAHPVITDHRRLNPALDQEPQQPQRDVDHDLHMHPGVIGHAQPLGLNLGHVPPGADLVVCVEAAEQRLQSPVSTRRRSHLSRLDRLARVAAEFSRSCGRHLDGRLRGRLGRHRAILAGATAEPKRRFISPQFGAPFR
jgi:hypothetical protein